MLKKKKFLLLLCILINHNIYAKCKVDPEFTQIAMATGGSIMCVNKNTVVQGELLGGYQLLASNIAFKAGWKILGHGSLDDYTYSDMKNLPNDKIRLAINNFPIDKGNIKYVYAIEGNGRKSDYAKKIREIINKTPNGSEAFYEYSFKPLKNSFYIAVQGVTKAGVPFILYSKDEFITSKYSDRELGLSVWRNVFHQLGDKISKSQKEELLYEVFKTP